MSYLTEAQKTQFMAMRKAMDNYIVKIVESPAEINDNICAIRTWSPGVFAKDDVRLYEGDPYKCVQNHDSSANPNWTPNNTPSLWMQYHGTTFETARPWVAPTGAHDMYLAGEWVIWTDNNVYQCLSDTVYDPATYPQAWQIHS